MTDKEKLRVIWGVSKNVLSTILVVGALILTFLIARYAYNFFATGLFGSTGKEYYLPGTEWPAQSSYVDDGQGVG